MSMEKYSRIKKIGEGSFGKALLVRCKESGKQMVVKEINMGRMSKKERDEARKETAVLAQLLHPNIVMYRESFEETGNLYIVMDYCDGGDLYGRINSQRGILFQEDQVLDWFVQICLSIKHIHDRKILHRDIKSQNIFLTRHGIVKLGDFGIAKVLNSTVELARTCIGTPYYLSPEICENKPYNNKSDIWSLGCVLYEMTTLKHAFEAGNMKNLVLKIIRGSYPPVPPRYSYEIRNLIAQLFKRNARDRPSINNVLRKPLLTNRIKRFLNDTEIAEEFSHTVMHGAIIKKALPPGQNRPMPVKASNAKRPPTPSTPRYNPASIYAPSSARRPNSANNDVKRPASAGRRPPSAGRRPPSADGGVADAAKRRQEMMEKERKRREEELKKKEERYAKAHKELQDKQKVARMNKAREEGWKSLLNEDDKRSVASASPRSSYDEQPPLQRVQPKLVAPKPTPYGQYPPSGAGQAKYNPYQAPVAHRAGGAGYLGANAAHAARRAEAVSARSRESAQNAKHLDEYLQRKKEAAMNKARGQADMLGLGAARAMGAARPVSAGSNPSNRPPSGRPGSAGGQGRRENQEDEYIARLRQIRLQNFNERRQLQDKMAGQGDSKYKPSVDQRQDPEFRKKKIEALRQQADERAAKLKAELEKKRKEAHELEKRKQQLAIKMGLPVKRAVSDVPKPAAVIPMTHAMKAIGAAKSPPPSATPQRAGIGMTAALSAIGAKPSDSEPQNSKSPREEQKKQVLRRLNERVSSSHERSRWGQPVKPMAQERSKWEEGGDGQLGAMALEETASKMEVTSARDQVVKHDAKSKEEPKETDPPQSARRQWGGPRGTVVKELHNAKLHETAQSDISDKTTTSPEDNKEGSGEVPRVPKVGSTITIVKNPAGKGTVVIRKTGDAHPHDRLDLPIIDDDSEDKITEKKEETKTAPAEEESEEMEQNVVEDDVKVEEVEEEEEEVAEDVAEREENKAEEVCAIVVEECETVTEPEVESEEPEVTEPEPEGLKPEVPKPEQETENTEETPQGADGRPIFESLAPAAGGAPGTEPKRDKTDLNPDGNEAQSTKQKKNASFFVGLTTGHFDIDRALLRTCSEPDLSKLFKTNVPENPFLFSGAVSLDAEALDRLDEELKDIAEDEGSGDDDEDEAAYEEALEAAAAAENPAGNEDDATESAQDDSEDPNSEGRAQDLELEEDSGEDDDEDLETLRESMMSLLQNDEVEDEGEEEEEVKEEQKKKVKKVVKKCKKKKKVLKSRVKKSEAGGRGDAAEYVRELSNTSEEDFATIRETMWTILEAASKMKDKTRKQIHTIPENRTAEAKEAEGKLQSTLVPGAETWQSDSGDEEDDYFEEDDNMFSRLEETRAKLETELGCDTFLKAYKTVQAIHEDEDENMEEGVSLVTSILGQEKSHLYPSILQLVMADGVFTEDNN